MSPDSPQAVEVKKTLDCLIDSASNSDFSILEVTYHDQMKIFMLDGNYDLHIMDKKGFVDHVTQSTEASAAPNMWAEYHSVEANETNGHVIISRKVNLTGVEQIVTLSIDFVFEDGRWQITREVIYAVGGVTEHIAT